MMTIWRESFGSPYLSLDTVFDAGARLLGAALYFHADVVRQLVSQRDHFTGLEQAHTVAQVQPRREVLADGQRRAADHLILLDASLIETEAFADALGHQTTGRAFERLRGGGQCILRTAAGAADLVQRTTGDQVRQGVRFADVRIRDHGDDGSLRRAADPQPRGLLLVDV